MRRRDVTKLAQNEERFMSMRFACNQLLSGLWLYLERMLILATKCLKLVFEKKGCNKIDFK